jgi:type VI protein secretion system component Hcp
VDDLFRYPRWFGDLSAIRLRMDVPYATDGTLQRSGPVTYSNEFETSSPTVVFDLTQAVMSTEHFEFKHLEFSPPGYTSSYWPAFVLEDPTGDSIFRVTSVSPATTIFGSTRFKLQLGTLTDQGEFLLRNCGSPTDATCPTTTGEIGWPQDERPTIAAAEFMGEGWPAIPLVAFDVATTNSGVPPPGTSIGPPAISNFSMTKAIDTYSAALWNAASVGRAMGQVRVGLTHTGAQHSYILKRVRVTSIEYKAEQYGETPSETLGLAFEEICTVLQQTDGITKETCFNVMTKTASGQ